MSSILPRPAAGHTLELPGLTTALAEARRGRYVFPVTPYNKTPHPDVRSWSDAATNDVTEIRERGWPERANVAIACKLSGLLVVDTDPRTEHDGVKEFTRLCEQSEPDSDYPDTRIVETPTGGLHHYYRNPDPEQYGNGTGSLPEGLDVRGGGRGDGGYVLAAGSVLDRRAYRGKPELQTLVGDGKPYRVHNTAKVIRPPDWLLRELRQKPRRTRPSGQACHALLREWPEVTLVRLNAELARIGQMSPGAPRPGRDDSQAGRNSQLYESACRFGEAVAVGRLDEETARAQLLDAATMCGLVDDDGLYRVEATIDSGLAKGAADLSGGTDADR